MLVTYELITPPAIEPVTVAEIKDHAKIDGTDEDVYLAALITAARESLSLKTGRAMITETWTATLDAWPRTGGSEWWDGVREEPITALEVDYLELSKVPFGQITAVELLDESDTATVWASSNYYVTKQYGRGRLVRKRGVSWPTILRDVAGIRITLTAGYGADANSVPLPLRHAIKLLVTHWYENRTPASACASSELMPSGLGEIIGQYRVMR